MTYRIGIEVKSYTNGYSLDTKMRHCLVEKIALFDSLRSRLGSCLSFEIYAGLTRRNALGSGVDDPQQPEFAIGFDRSAVIFQAFNRTAFLVDLPDQGGSAIVTLQERRKRVKHYPRLGGNDFCLGDPEIRSREYPAVGERTCRCE